MKIYFSGCSGTGKSTLAKWIEDTYGIPFITTSTKPLWDKYGVKNHIELIKIATENPQLGIDFQFDLLRYRKEVLSQHESFVTDRSPVDNLAYFLMQNSHIATEDQTEEYIKQCKELLFTGTHLFFIDFTSDIKLENDGMRVSNKYYQQMSNSVFKDVINDWMWDIGVEKLQYSKISVWDMDTRKDQVTRILNQYNHDKVAQLSED